MKAAIHAIEYSFPDRVLTNEELANAYAGWTSDKIKDKTGICKRYVARVDECSSDLGVAAAQKLFASGRVSPSEVDYLLFCTQSPDYLLPTTACLVQQRLGIPTTAGALDFNLGCSGFVYGLSLAKGLIETGQARTVLLITAETYSKFIHPGDKSVRTLFGDAAAATLVEAAAPPTLDGKDPIGPFVFGTDGSGAPNLIVSTGGLRQPFVANAPAEVDSQGNVRSINNLYMNGAEIFNFALRVVPESVARLLRKAGVAFEEVDLFVLHQANKYMLDHLRRKLRIPEERFCVALEGCGNTVSSTIPIALKDVSDQGILRPGALVMIVGFGVGYSWGANLLRWHVPNSAPLSDWQSKAGPAQCLRLE